MPGDISENLRFADRILVEYDWDASKQDSIRDEIRQIRRRQDDPRLYLGVVGEFTTGKSTFINALLRRDLLNTSMKGATTCSATLLQYGSVPAIEVISNDGSIQRLEEGNNTDTHLSLRFQEFLQRYSAQEEYAHGAREVRVSLPSPTLQKGLVIVDTPGTDITNPRHKEVTAWAIRNICDAFVVVISAQRQVSKTMMDFIRTSLPDILNRCIFIVTMIDLIEEDEREAVLRYISNQLRSTLGLPHPAIFAVSPVFLSETYAAKRRTLDRGGADAFSRDFIAVEEQIFWILHENREQIVREKLSRLMVQLLADLDNHLSALEDTYAARHAALLENYVDDLDSFIEGRKATHLTSIDWQVDASTSRLLGSINDAFDQSLGCARTNIQAVNDADLLRASMAGTIAHMNEQVQREIRSSIQTYVDDVDRAYIAETARFESEFSAMYNTLSTLGGLAPGADIELASQGIMVQEMFSYSHNLLHAVESNKTKESYLLGGGALGGAIIGTMLFPVVGTVIGGVLGWVAGGMLTGGLDGEKRRYITKIGESIAVSRTTIRDLIREDAANYARKKRDAFIRVIDSYFEEYNVLVERMNRRDQDERQRLEALKSRIAQDRREITRRRGDVAGSPAPGAGPEVRAAGGRLPSRYEVFPGE